MCRKKIFVSGLVLFLITGFAFLYQNGDEIMKPEDKFTVRKIMEKDFESAGVYFFKPKFVVSADEPMGNYFFRDNLPKMFSDGVFVPQIIHVDDMGNIFITDVMTGVRMFDSSGKMIEKIVFTPGFRFSELVSGQDSENIIYEVKNDINDFQVNSFTVSRDVKIIRNDLRVEKSYEKAIENYSKSRMPKVLLNKIGFAGGTDSLLRSGYGKFLSPGEIILYRFTEDFKGYNIFSRVVVSQNQDEIPSEFITEKIDIEKLSDAKFLFINSNSLYFDKSENIYLWGLSSDEVLRDTTNWFKQIKISNPKYNVWKVTH